VEDVVIQLLITFRNVTHLKLVVILIAPYFTPVVMYVLVYWKAKEQPVPQELKNCFDYYHIYIYYYTVTFIYI
jgi:hypothetical protein